MMVNDDYIWLLMVISDGYIYEHLNTLDSKIAVHLIDLLFNFSGAKSHRPGVTEPGQKLDQQSTSFLRHGSRLFVYIYNNHIYTLYIYILYIYIFD
jgi:hypothetical protein